MNIAIIGFNIEGRATYDYYATHHPDYTLTICDQDADLAVPEGVSAVLGTAYLDDLDRFDLVVRSAGIHPRKLLQNNPGIAHKITTHVNEFVKHSPTRHIIGVTGTKGKGTTSTLITRMLEATGKTARLGGNIGVPPLSFIDDLDETSWVVLELSSFQLIDFDQAPHIGVCLMIAAEHLDWHADIEEYLTAKEQLFARQGTTDVAVYYHENQLSARIAGAGQGRKIPYFHTPGAEVINGAIIIDGHEICKTSELKLLGQHNWQNACAAVTAVWYACYETDMSALISALRAVLTTFTGLPYRLELIRTLHDVRYYNDSFGTTPETAIVALQAFADPKVVILGGSDKGAQYDELAQAVKDNNVRQALLIGDQADRIRAALTKVGFTNMQPGGTTMAEIVQTATAIAQPGDIVLLSTGCASFDMFQNYKDRGNQFNEAVTALQ